MNRYPLIATYFLFLTSYLNAQSIGVGVLTVNNTYPLALYTQENDTLPAAVIRFKPRWHPQGDFLVSYNYKSTIPIKPFFMYKGKKKPKQTDLSFFGHIYNAFVSISSIMNPQGFLDEKKIKGVQGPGMYLHPSMRFRVLENNPKNYKIVINENTQQALYVKKQPDAIYYGFDKQIHEFWYELKEKSLPNWYVFETWHHFWVRAKRMKCIEDFKYYDGPDRNELGVEECSFYDFEVVTVQNEWLCLNDHYCKNIWVKWFENGQWLQMVGEEDDIF
jgi:hypothetical protein